jgi:amino acid transporter
MHKHSFDLFTQYVYKTPFRSFIGYTNAHYVLSETKDPVKTIKRAAPLAMILITALYLLVNISYLVVVSKEDILGSGRVVAWV